MKYTALKGEKAKSITIPLLNGGVNLCKNSNSISNEALAFCKNVWYKDGKLRSRPSIQTEIENLIGEEIINAGLCYDCFLSDAEIFIDGEHYRIATAEVFYTESAYNVYVFLIDDNGKQINIGSMQFLRTDSTTFFIPENITFFSGKEQNGGGVFAFITTVNMMDFKTRDYKIYEVTKEFDGWQRNTNYYIPTVYINGRGNDYDLAHQLGIAYTGAPKELEPLNLLDGRFYAYYSSDGYSASFRLPFSQLALNTVICRVYLNSQSYIEWIIEEGADSKTERLYDKDITAKLDREKGIISFYSGSNTYALPQMNAYKENNIRIFAKKEIPNSFQKVVSCKHSTTEGYKTVFSGGLAGSEIYFSRYSNPLYFPMLTDNCVGSPASEITALFSFNGKVLAFKENSMYTVEITDYEPLNITNLLIDNPDIFYSSAKFKIKTASSTVGCKNKSTIAIIEGCIIWQASDLNVYSFSNGKIYTLSDNIKPYIAEWWSDETRIISAAVYNNCYVLCSDTKAVIMEWTGKSAEKNAWYIWEFPANCFVTSAFSHNGRCTFLCSSAQKDIHFTATFGEGWDSVLALKNGITLEQYDFEAIIKTKNYRLGGLGRCMKITNALLELETAGNAKIKIAGAENSIDFKLTKTDVCHNLKNAIKLVATLKCGDRVSLEISSKQRLGFGMAEICYTNIN